MGKKTRTVIIFVGYVWVCFVGAVGVLWALPGVALVLWGCYEWTKQKERHWAFMFWGLLAPIGLLGIYFLKDRS